MRKLFLLLTVMGLLLCGSPSFASVGINVNGTPSGEATDIYLTCLGTNPNPTPDGSTYYASCSQNLAESGFVNAGYVSVASTSATISPNFTYVWKVLDTNADPKFTSGVLANGTPGQMLTITAAGYAPAGTGTGATYTLSFTTSRTLNTIVMTKKNDSITLVYLDDTQGWFLQHSNNVGLTINYRN